MSQPVVLGNKGTVIAAMAAVMALSPNPAVPLPPVLLAPGGYGKPGRRIKLRDRKHVDKVKRRTRRKIAARSRRRNR